jgi:uncharacterized protein YggU (UPF0235/DUF167 family)
MKINKETPENYVKLDMVFEPDEETRLIEYAKTHILEDKEALINYAFIKCLSNSINILKSNINVLKGIKNSEKQSTTNLEKSQKKVGYKPNYKNRK